MIKNIALMLACASLGAGTAANARSDAPDGSTNKFCIKYVNGVPFYVPCKR